MTTTSYKPFFAGALIVAADKFLLMQPDMNSSLYFGLSYMVYLVLNILVQCYQIIKHKYPQC